MKSPLESLTHLEIYEASLSTGRGGRLFLGRRGREKFLGCMGSACLAHADKAGELDGQDVFVGPCDHDNAVVIRDQLRWTAPKLLGLRTSIGLGDRLGLATPGHIRAARGKGLGVVLAQQSIREMTRTRRTPENVMDAATYGVLQEGFTDGFGSDADHLQKTEDIDATVPAGFTMFTIDPGAHVINEADALSDDEALAATEQFNYASLETDLTTLWERYVGKTFPLDGGGEVVFRSADYARALVKYGRAVAHTVTMYRYLCDSASEPFELEVSVDETESPTTPAEHYFFANELSRLGVKWVSMAPRFVGRFEKGVDYLGDLDAFRASFAEHVAVMRTLGPYKISIHSGSDKFSVYPIVSELTDGLVHVKTAGTSYLEAIRAIARIDPGLFREIYDFARAHYEDDKKTYHVSADMAKVPAAAEWTDEQLAERIDDFDTRQALHVTFGSVLTLDDGERFRRRIYAALAADEEAHYAALAAHLGRHAEPFARPAK